MGNIPDTKKARDTQRSRVYLCDEAIRHLSRADVSTVPLMEAYVKRVWASERVHQAFPEIGHPPPKVKDGRARKRACANSLWVSMPVHSRVETVMLHELAHSVTQRVYGYKVAGHGWQYCSVYLKLVLYMMGRDAHDALKAAFKKFRVRFTEPRKRAPLSPEQRVVLLARLNAARLKLTAGTGAA